MQQLFKNTACSSIFKDTQLVLAIVCFFFLPVCVYLAGGVFIVSSVLRAIKHLQQLTHTSTSDLTIHSTVIYWCDPSLSCFIMATIGDIIHK